MTEKGNSTLFGLLFLTIFVLIGINFFQLRLDKYKDLKDKQILLLCAKSYNGELRDYIQKMEAINKVIASISAGEKIINLTPIAFTLIKVLSKGSLFTLKRYQEYLGISLVKKTAQLLLKGCTIPNLYSIVPYRLGLTGYVRNSLDQTVRKSQQWKIRMYKGSYQITNFHIFQGPKTTSKIRKVKRFLSFL